MKKCPYCGKEYPDDVERCLIDNEILLGSESQPSPIEEKEEVVPVLPPLASPSAPIFPTVILTEQQMRIVEVVLVCLIAFGGGLLTSTYSYFGNSFDSSGGSIFNWIVHSFRELSSLGLLWYVLQRHGKSFADLGLTWTQKDIGWSIILRGLELLAFDLIYNAIYFTGLTDVSHKASSAHVGHILFSNGVSFVTILFQFINPFFEELIVRAYVMTEVRRLINSATKAIIVSTLLQTSYHFYQGAPAAFAHGAGFLIWSIYYAKTNRITPIILAHLYTDVGSTLWYFFRQ